MKQREVSEQPLFTAEDFEKVTAFWTREQLAELVNAKVAPLLEENERLRAEKESWGNEFTAVHMAKERVENLEQQLDFAIECAQMRGAAAGDAEEKVRKLEAEIQTFADAWNELETLQALLLEAREFVVCSRDCSVTPCECGARSLETRIEKALGKM